MYLDFHNSHNFCQITYPLLYMRWQDDCWNYNILLFCQQIGNTTYKYHLFTTTKEDIIVKSHRNKNNECYFIALPFWSCVYFWMQICCHCHTQVIFVVRLQQWVALHTFLPLLVSLISLCSFIISFHFLSSSYVARGLGAVRSQGFCNEPPKVNLMYFGGKLWYPVTKILLMFAKNY